MSVPPSLTLAWPWPVTGLLPFVSCLSMLTLEWRLQVQCGLFSVFSKIRITMPLAQLTHSRSLITCPVFLWLSDHINCEPLCFPYNSFTPKKMKSCAFCATVIKSPIGWCRTACKASPLDILLGGEALAWGWCGEPWDSRGLMPWLGAVIASMANFCLKASSLRRLANQL